MNRGILQSSLVQQMMMAAENPNWWNINNSTSPNLLNFPHSSFPNFPSSWHDGQDHLPESWSQLLLGGLVSEDEKGCVSQVQAKKLEDCEEEILKKEQSAHATYMYGHGGSGVGVGRGSGVEDYNHQLPPKQSWSQMIPASSPQSCVTSFSSNMLDFSNNSPVDTRPRHPQLQDRSSSECNSNAATNGGAVKKARIQSSTSQTAFKVRKEKLGDRITALHQLVSPFGKTDTASVLLEAIGYIRFLQSQIEALSLPYFGNGSASTRHQHSVQGERNCLFPEDPGQLLNENCLKRKGVSEQDSDEEQKKDLRSRGLCLVPVSCTLQVGSDNGADYWAPAFSGGFR